MFERLPIGSRSPFIKTKKLCITSSLFMSHSLKCFGVVAI